MNVIRPISHARRCVEYRTCLTMFVLTCGSVVFTSGLQAQSAKPISTSSWLADTTPLPASLAAITTDTGDFAPGHRNFDRYRDPRWCLAAAQGALFIQQRTLEARTATDVLMYTPAKDTLPSVVTAVTHACVVHLGTADTATHNRYPLARFVLALTEGNDDVAQHMLEELVREAPTPHQKAWAFELGIAKYLDAKPARLTAALAAVAQLDTFSTVSDTDRLAAHELLFAYGKVHDDRALVRRETDMSIQIAMSMPLHAFESRALMNYWGKYQELRHLVFIRHPDSARVIAQQLQHDYRSPAFASRIATACREKLTDSLYRATLCQPVASLPIDSVMTLLAPSWEPHSTPPAEPLRADFLFPEPGRTIVPPVRGVVSVVLRFAPGCVGGYFFGIERDCARDYDAIRQLVSRYGASRVAVTILVYAPPFTLFDELHPPAGVAESYRRFLQDDLKLPVSVAVRNMSVGLQVPTPDGRTYYAEPKGYSDLYSKNLIVVTDGDARVIYRSEEGPVQKEHRNVMTDGRESMIGGEENLASVVDMLEEKLQTKSLPSSLHDASKIPTLKSR